MRPLRKSLSEAIQMWGRGLRSSPGTGKKDCLLLDFSGNIVRMAEDYSDIFYNGLDALDAGEKLDKTIVATTKRSRKGKPAQFADTSRWASAAFPVGTRLSKPSLVEHEHGEMQEIRIGKTKYADDKRHLWEQACSYARGYSAPDKQQGRAKHIFRDISGEWPDSSWNIATTQACRSLARCSTRSSRATSHTRNLSGGARHERDDTNRVCHFFHPGDRPRTVGRDRDGCQKRNRRGRARSVGFLESAGRVLPPESAKAVWRSIKSSGRITVASLYHHAKAHGWRDDGTLQPLSARQIAERRQASIEKAAAADKEAEKEHAMALRGPLRCSQRASWPTIHTSRPKVFPDARALVDADGAMLVRCATA